jgi:hypothetical protein
MHSNTEATTTIFPSTLSSASSSSSSLTSSEERAAPESVSGGDKRALERSPRMMMMMTTTSLSPSSLSIHSPSLPDVDVHHKSRGIRSACGSRSKSSVLQQRQQHLASANDKEIALKHVRGFYPVKNEEDLRLCMEGLNSLFNRAMDIETMATIPTDIQNHDSFSSRTTTNVDHENSNVHSNDSNTSNRNHRRRKKTPKSIQIKALWDHIMTPPEESPTSSEYVARASELLGETNAERLAALLQVHGHKM